MEAAVTSHKPVEPAVPARAALPEPGAEAPRRDASSSEAPGEPASSGVAASSGGASRGLWISSTYFAEGLPYAIAHKVAGEFFTAAGASLEIIGLTSLYGLPWNLKFLWSPLVDLHGSPRRWLVGVEIALAAIVLGLAAAADSGAIWLVAALFGAVAVAAATHDIAVDGFYLQALDKDAQAAFSGLRVGAYRLALLAGALLVAFAGWASFGAAFAVAAGGLALLAIAHAAGLPRPAATPGAGAAPGATGLRRYVEPFRVYLRQPQIASSLAFILCYRAGDALMFAMSSPLLKSLGLDTAARGNVGGVGTVASIAGSILGGVIIKRWGLARTIFPIALVQSLAILLYVALAWARPALPWVVALVTLEQLAAGVGTAVLAVFLMRRCVDGYKSSHFAIGSALMSVSATFAGSVSGYLAASAGFTAFFAIAFAASIPGVVLSRLVPRD
ncbi:putative membrane protein [Sorangium cellulosum So ce56]|uniref:Membrane protein n=1 Tax=Sorangium cellulosum (strain So ce56) TaxID=448385 RepID=A9FUZ1_SORC5|nr:MFS transporter [Sorangium cellulosum]CAN92219.1 putative membrane protein [Sorangium cellulosum So ce56]